MIDKLSKYILPVLLFIATNLNLSGAQTDSLSIGTRVRVSAPRIKGESIIGKVAGLSEHVVLIKTNRSKISVPATAIARLDVSSGYKSGVGTASGTVAWLLVLGILNEKRNPPHCEYIICVYKTQIFTKEDAPEIGLAVGLAGLATYLIVRGQERWSKISPEVSVGLLNLGKKNNQLKPMVSVRIPITKRR